MLSKCDHPTNLTRYHNLPHLNLESRISLTSYSSWSSTMTGPGCRGCGHSTISSGMDGRMMETDMTGGMFFSHAERRSLIAAGEMHFVTVKGLAHLWSSFFMGPSEE